MRKFYVVIVCLSVLFGLGALPTVTSNTAYAQQCPNGVCPPN